MFKVTKQSEAHEHEHIFDTEDEAYAFLHGLLIGADFPVHNYEDDDAEAFCEGVKMGVMHRGRVTRTEFTLPGHGGKMIKFSVRKEGV